MARKNCKFGVNKRTGACLKSKRKASAKGGRTTKCKYVAKRGSKTMANKLASELKRDGFRAVVNPGAGGGVAAGYDVFSCGKLKSQRRRRKK